MRKLLPRYSKGKYNADSLIRNIPLALSNAEKFCQNEVLLISEVGTNIGKLILLLKEDNEQKDLCIIVKLYCTNPDDMNYETLAKRARYYK